MNKRHETLGEQLRREAQEYLADFMAIVRSLREAEGRIAFGLFAAVAVMMFVWFVSAIGFNPPNDHVLAFMSKWGIRQCRPVTNFTGSVLLIDLIVLMMLVVMCLGAMFAMVERMRKGLPRDASQLIALGVALLVFGVGGIVFMQIIC